MKYFVPILFCLFIVIGLNAQDKKMAKKDMPYYEIPAYPKKYSSGNIVARMIDGLGYRYFWATDELRSEDLAYKPSDDSRDAAHTLDHIYHLAGTILMASKGEPNVRPLPKEELTWEQKRLKTLQRLKAASDNFKSKKKKAVKNDKLIFESGGEQRSFPLWNLINGPIADAIYHTGQIVAYRRASGNPINSKVNVFTGKNRE